VAPDSWYGALLKGIFNFSPQTTWLQAVAWVLYVATVLTLFLRPVKAPSAPRSPATAPRATSAA
jgi:high-affinity iron transporter